MLLPAWLASMVQVPAATNVAVVPETVQTLVVADVKATARPELAVAESVSGVPTVCVPGLAKVMVCAVRPLPPVLVAPPPPQPPRSSAAKKKSNAKGFFRVNCILTAFPEPRECMR